MVSDTFDEIVSDLKGKPLIEGMAFGKFAEVALRTNREGVVNGLAEVLYHHLPLGTGPGTTHKTPMENLTSMLDDIDRTVEDDSE